MEIKIINYKFTIRTSTTRVAIVQQMIFSIIANGNPSLELASRVFIKIRSISSNVSHSYTKMHVLDEVREAIQNKMPVVALESTIITHG